MVDQVKDLDPRNQYTATSGQTIFPYTFPIFDKDDLVVIQEGTTLTEGTDYTVSGVGDEDGGDVTLTTGATTGDTITIYRDIALERLVDYQDSGDFLASDVNDDFDRQLFMIQQLNRDVQRALRVSQDDEIASTQIGDLNTRANKLLAFDASGELTYQASTTLSPVADSLVDTVAAAKALNLAIGDYVRTGGYTSFNDGGGALYRVVAGGTGTDDGGSYHDMSNSNQLELIADDCVNLKQFGAKTDGTDASAALVNAIAFSGSVDIGTGTYTISTKADITLTRDTVIKGCGGVLLTTVANGGRGDNISINCNGFSLELDGVNVSGNGVAGNPMYVFDNQESSGKVVVKGGSYNDSYSAAGSGNNGNHGLFIRGGFEEVNVAGAEFKNHTREVGAGNPGVTGTSGLTVTLLNTFDVKNVLIDRCSFIDITNGETTDNANNTDADGLKVFANVAGNVVRETKANISNCYFKNCKGRAVKSQVDVCTVIAPTIYRNISGITGSSVEIDLQIHGGDMIAPTFVYEDSTSGEATFVRTIAPMSIFAPGTLLKPRICNVSDVTIHDNTTGGSSMAALISATQSDLTSSFDSVINVSNVISTAKHESFMTCPAMTGTGVFYANVDNVYVKEIDTANGLFGFASSANLKDEAKIRVSKFVHAGTETKPSYQTTSPSSLAKPTLKMDPTIGVSDTTDNGVSSHNFKVTGIDENGVNTVDTGLHVFSQSVGDDATMTIEIPNVDNRGIATISTTLSRTSFGTVSIDSSGALNFGAAAAANFNPGGTTNPDVDGDLNVWATGGNLLIKNRLGSTRTITVVFQG